MERQQGAVLWFMGLSGAGKTTTSRYVAAELLKQGRHVEVLDGDELRETICKGLGYSREERIENIKRIVYVAKLLSRNGIDVLVSAITPYQEMRDYARSQLPDFVEIYVECPIDECERRDVKGLYAKARNGKLSQFTGVSDPFEEPLSPDLVLSTASASLEDNGDVVMSWMQTKWRLMYAAQRA
ncbi:MAG: adenylyl-sulfate kinase [Candidatus Pristimantibacillus sp.]